MKDAAKRKDQEELPPRPAPAGARARERILDAAEQLFAREGAAAVTLRSIAAAAEANVAAVNYYFGSKEKLFEEMFLRRVVPLNDDRLARLADCIAAAEGGAPALEAVVAAYALPALRLTETAGASARAIIVQYSLGRVLALPEVNAMLVRYYDRVRRAFVAALRQAAPHLAAHEVVRRYYWMGGSILVTLAVPPGMVEAADDTVSLPARRARETLADDLIAFLVQGFRAEARGCG